MIKRPFLWGIAVFIAGILMAWNNIPLICLLPIALIGWSAIYLLMFRFKRYINCKDSFLWGLPLLMLLGALSMGDRMKPPDIDIAFEEKSDCNLTGEITMIVKKSWGTVYYLKNNKINLLSDNNCYLVEDILVNTYTQEIQVSQHQVSKPHEYRIGNTITVSGVIKKFSSNSNPGGFNEQLYYKFQNISYKVSAESIAISNDSYSKYNSVISNIKDELIQIYTTILPKKEAGTLMAMLLGEKYLLEDEIKTLYQENGISHILAISGLHVSMVGAAIYFILRKLRLGLLASTLISLVFVYSYGILTNFSVSTNRALVMYSVLLLAKLIGKTFDILSALSLSAFLILLQNPMELFSAGFLLSFSAVLGIALILPSLNHIYEARCTLLKSIYVCVSAQVLALPLILYYFFQIPLYSILINIIVLPFTTLLMLTTILAGILGIVSLPLGVFVAGASNYILKFYEITCILGSSLPGNLLTVGRPGIIRIMIYLLLILIFVKAGKSYKKKRIIILLALALVVLIIPKPRKGLTVAMLDVGQGEAIFMENDTGTTFFIDGGSSDVNQVGRYRIVPYLLSRGTDTLDYAIVTHTDEDHVSGLIELIEGEQITINHIILPNTNTKNEAYYEIERLAKDNDIKLIYIAAGDVLVNGRLQITTLHPPVGYQPLTNNDYSTVLSISYGKFDMLLTGDIEAKGEKKLIEYLTRQEIKQSDYDVLQVAHHGSRNSTSEELLLIIRPELSLISCGRNNRYGHPHPELLDRLNDIGSEVAISYDSGAITIMTDGEKMVVEEYMKLVTGGRGY